MIKPFEIEILTSTLPNILDWESTDIHEDFVRFVSEENKILSPDKASTLLKKYLDLPPLERDKLTFDLEGFITKTVV